MKVWYRSSDESQAPLAFGAVMSLLVCATMHYTVKQQEVCLITRQPEYVDSTHKCTFAAAGGVGAVNRVALLAHLPLNLMPP